MAILDRERYKVAIPQLEQMIKDLKSEVANLGDALNNVYPVGASFETSDPTFNPAKVYGGEWELDTSAQLVAYAKTASPTDIKKSYNIDSITYQPTGGAFPYYQIDFIKPMADAYYMVAVSCEVGGIGNEIMGVYGEDAHGFRVDVANRSGQTVTPSSMSVMVFGHLAEPDRIIWRRKK